MTDNHPITPPPELVAQWASESFVTQHLCTQIARWGADQELEACCERISSELRGRLRPAHRIVDDLRAARRPKPLSLKEQALALLEIEHGLNVEDLALLRRALETIND
jgi:hypothetical protein